MKTALLKEESMTMSDIICDVAIIGYGPTGQMLSLLLGEKGYRVAVFERWPNLYPKPRAIVYDHEIARIFQAASIAEALASVVEPSGVYEWRNARGETLLSFDGSEQGISGWPSNTMFSQPQLEAILDVKVKALPTVTVYQGWAVEHVEQTQDAVGLQVRKQSITSSGELVPAEDRLSVRGRYVIGADGANSLLREHMRTSLTDLGFLFDWLVVDIIPHEPREWDPPNVQVATRRVRRPWFRAERVAAAGSSCDCQESAWKSSLARRRSGGCWLPGTSHLGMPRSNATPSTPLRRAGPIPGAMDVCFSPVTQHT
jgi:2-polyprenyl-6-methoxyphenol hydroxylase-like FAD-dependent oxidoreductase